MCVDDDTGYPPCPDCGEFTECPDIYLGACHCKAPPKAPAKYWENPAIGITPDLLSPGKKYQVQVTVRNHGLQNSPHSKLQVFYADPATDYAVDDLDPLTEKDLVVPYAVNGAEPEDGEFMHAFEWTVPKKGDSVCMGLVARVANTDDPPGECPYQDYGSVAKEEDPRLAVRRVVIDYPKFKNCRPKRGFAFGATNLRGDEEDTRLVVRVINPNEPEDRARLKALVAEPYLDWQLSCRNLKFARPRRLQVGLGRERVLRPPRRVGERICPPRIAHVGSLTARGVRRLLQPDSELLDVTKECRPLELKLARGELQQTVVQVEPCTRDNVVYAVEARHLDAKDRTIGGLTILFVPPHNYFRDRPHDKPSGPPQGQHGGPAKGKFGR